MQSKKKEKKIKKTLKISNNLENYILRKEGFVIFVAMSFHEKEEPDLKDSFQAICKSAEQISTPLKIYVQKMDLIEDDCEISQNIMDKIEKADVVITDFTLNSPNVYHESGYARALHKRIIQIAREGTSLNFNVCNWRTLYYTDAFDLEKRLTPEIQTAIFDSIYIRKKISYDHIQIGLNTLLNKVNEKDPKFIIGINRGGAIIGGMLCKLVKQMLYQIIVDLNRNKINFEWEEEIMINNKKRDGELVFLIDDRFDSGRHMLRAKKFLEDQGFKVYSIVFVEVNSGGPKTVKPDWSAYIVESNEVLFPWEYEYNPFI